MFLCFAISNNSADYNIVMEVVCEEEISEEKPGNMVPSYPSRDAARESNVKEINSYIY